MQVFAGTGTHVCGSQTTNLICTNQKTEVSFPTTTGSSGTLTSLVFTLMEVPADLTQVCLGICLTVSDETITDCGFADLTPCNEGFARSGAGSFDEQGSSMMDIVQTSDGNVIIFFLTPTKELIVSKRSEDGTTTFWAKKVLRTGGSWNSVQVAKNIADDGTHVYVCGEDLVGNAVCWKHSLSTGATSADQGVTGAGGETFDFEDRTGTEMERGAIGLGHLHVVGKVKDTDDDAMQLIYDGTITVNRGAGCVGCDEAAKDAQFDGTTYFGIAALQEDTAGGGFEEFKITETDEGGVVNCDGGFNEPFGGGAGDNILDIDIDINDGTPKKWVLLGTIPFNPPRSMYFDIGNGGCAGGISYGFQIFRSGKEFASVQLPPPAGETARAAFGGSDIILLDLRVGVVPTEVKGIQLVTTGQLQDMDLNSFGETTLITDDPNTAFLFDADMNNVIEIISDNGKGEATYLTDDGFFHVLSGSDAQHTVYEFQFLNIPEFSLTTMLMAILISGFILMFVIRRRK